MNDFFSQPSTQQTKSNLWAGATIWANLFIVLIIAVVAGAIVSNVSGGIVTFFPYWQMIVQIITILLVIFAIWLGVRSVLKVTPIDQKNNFYVGLWATLVPIVLQVSLIVFIVLSGSGQSITVPGWILLISNLVLGDLTIFVSCIYFLKINPKNRISVSETNTSKSTLFFILFLVTLLILVIWVLPYIGSVFSPAPTENIGDTGSQSSSVPTEQAGGVVSPGRYHSSKYGFDLQYPAGWKATESNNFISGEQDIAFDNSVNTKGDTQFIISVISPSLPVDSTSPKEWVGTLYPGSTDIQTVAIGGKNGFQFSQEGTPQSPAIVTNVIPWGPGKAMEFECAIGSHLSDSTHTCDSILKSVHFTNQ